MAEESSDPRVGATLDGRYRVVERLAQGAMGVVYRGEHLELGRAVAVKFLHPLFAAEKDIKDRFRREALTMSRLDHPNCVSVLDMGISPAPYIVMDFVTGVVLGDLIEDGPLPARRAIEIIRQVLAGLEHAHGQGIIHRDIKPANVMLAEVAGTGDHVRILDFGLAKFRDAEQTLSGVVVGTPSYMSPEQASGKRLDARSDVYSTGVLLYQLLTGVKPFKGTDTYELILMHVEQPAPSLADAGVAPFSAQLEAAVARALTKDPEARFQTATALSDALAAVPEAHGRGAAQAPPLPSSARAATLAAAGPVTAGSSIGSTVAPRRRGRPLLLLGLLAAAVALAIGPGRDLLGDSRERAGRAVGGLLDRGDAGAASTDVATVAEARALAAAGDLDGALRGLHALRRARPDDAAVSLALGALYFDKGEVWWAEGLAAYRDAISKEPALRTDEGLLRDVFRSLARERTANLASDVVVRSLGESALPRLRAAVRDPAMRPIARRLIEDIEKRTSRQ